MQIQWHGNHLALLPKFKKMAKLHYLFLILIAFTSLSFIVFC